MPQAHREKVNQDLQLTSHKIFHSIIQFISSKTSHFKTSKCTDENLKKSSSFLPAVSKSEKNMTVLGISSDSWYLLRIWWLSPTEVREKSTSSNFWCKISNKEQEQWQPYHLAHVCNNVGGFKAKMKQEFSLDHHFCEIKLCCLNWPNSLCNVHM
jgi:hypothetical protein